MSGAWAMLTVAVAGGNTPLCLMNRAWWDTFTRRVRRVYAGTTRLKVKVRVLVAVVQVVAVTKVVLEERVRSRVLVCEGVFA